MTKSPRPLAARAVVFLLAGLIPACGRTAIKDAIDPAVEVDGTFEAGQGADVALAYLDSNPRPEMILMVYSGEENIKVFSYRVGFNLNYSGIAERWSEPIFAGDVGPGDVQGAGVAVHDFDGNGRPELILLAFRNFGGATEFRYKVGFQLDQAGVAASWGDVHEVAGLGLNEPGAQGAGVEIVNLDTADPRPEMILMAYANPEGPNDFRYKIGWNVDGAAITDNWSGLQTVPGFGRGGQGAGLAALNLDQDSRPEMILMAYDEKNTDFRARVGFNLSESGVAQSWSDRYTAPGVGSAQGAGIELGQIDDNPKPDAVLVAYHNPAGKNAWRYRIVWNVDATDGLNVGGWGQYIWVPPVDGRSDGAGLATVDSDLNGPPELVLMSYANPRGGNSFRYRISWNLTPDGAGSLYEDRIKLPGVGRAGEGAGVAFTNLDTNPRPEMFLMAYHDPSGANTFRYRVVRNIEPALVMATAGETIEVDGVSDTAAGAGLAFTQLDGDPGQRPEMIVMAYDDTLP